jgi:hypothetical protein
VSADSSAAPGALLPWRQRKLLLLRLLRLLRLRLRKLRLRRLLKLELLLALLLGE